MAKDKLPKRPMSAFASFMQNIREEQERRCPGVTQGITDFSRSCANEWNQMSQNERKPYHAVAEVERNRYQQEMKAYEQRQRCACCSSKKPKTFGGVQKKRPKPKATKVAAAAPAIYFINYPQKTAKPQPKKRAAPKKLKATDMVKKIAKMFEANRVKKYRK